MFTILIQLMHLALFNYINDYATTPISMEDYQLLENHFTYKKIRKKQYFLEKGEVGKYFAFILNGAMKKYYIDEKGAEHITNLYLENWWVGDMESYTMLTPTIYNIDAWEDTEVLLITNENSKKITNEFPSFNEMLLKLDEKHKIATQKRITATISFTAEKRYESFINSHPDFLERFPLHVIASYLGITKETLSRIRNHISQK